MKVPFEWLKELVKIKSGPDQVTRTLTMAGLETVVEAGNILEVDVLPNRSDCWSIRGIAREVAALTKTKVKSSKRKIKEISKRAGQSLKVVVRHPDLCPRYMARVIEGIRVAESPDWLKKRLENAGIRAINNVVDVTNYLLLELGQPMHAFDARLIADKTIVVRRAALGEKITTLDGKEHELGQDMLVIADKQKAIALGGIMGAANTEVSNKTTKVVLESAYFDPVSVHKTAKLLKLRSESSVRFEHGVDWRTVEEALDRGAAMIAQLGKGAVQRGKIDLKGKERKPKAITLRPEKVNQVLGTDLTRTEMSAILKRLGFGVKAKKVTIPLFRAADISREIDLIEEIARIHGYDKIEATMPKAAFPGKAVDLAGNFRSRVGQVLAGCGLNEVQTYSMLGPEDLKKAGLDIEQAVAISNPLNVEESLMRTLLLPSLLNVIQHNVNRQQENVYIFEIGKVYLPAAEGLPEEKWLLCAAASGSPFRSALDKAPIDYFYMKGVLENLLAVLGINNVDFAAAQGHLLQPGKGASVGSLGVLGQLHPEVSKNYGLEKPVCFFEIDLAGLFELAAEEQRYKPLPKFPFVSRDIAMFLPRGRENQAVLSLIREVGGGLVEDVYPFDKYKDSLAYRVIYRDPDKTLTDAEVNAKHAEITRALESRLNVRIRK
ncbi:phenylalanine--tRNA ligase subunit beta [Candidatus Margulisiibacteriota bacterium]